MRISEFIRDNRSFLAEIDQVRQQRDRLLEAADTITRHIVEAEDVPTVDFVKLARAVYRTQSEF